MPYFLVDNVIVVVVRYGTVLKALCTLHVLLFRSVAVLRVFCAVCQLFL